MGTIKTLEEAVKEIDIKFQAAIDADNKGKRARLAAGQMLLDLRKRIEDGEAGAVDWWNWYDQQKFVRGRKDAEKVMRLAGAKNPEAAAETEKAKAREGMRKNRGANVSSKKKTKEVQGNSGRPKLTAVKDDKPDDDQTIWRRGLLSRAEVAINDAAFEDWSHFTVDHQLVQVVTQAADAWNKLATYLEEIQTRPATDRKIAEVA
jgi:hypothetical protein